MALSVGLMSRCTTTAGKSCEGFILASDAERDLLEFTVPTPPAHGTLNIDAPMKGFSYFPKPGFVGTDTFTLVADDTPGVAGGASPPVTVTVVVN